MSLWIILLIMLAAGVAGGVVNYLLPANEDPVKLTRIRSAANCIALGIGATLLVPIFLQVAQSSLLDTVHTNFAWCPNGCHDSDSTARTPSERGIEESHKPLKEERINRTDSLTKEAMSPNDSIPAETRKSPKTRGAARVDCSVHLKNYFLYTSYCFLAAAAGFRFINSIMDSVLKDKQLANLKNKNARITHENEEVKAVNRKLDRVLEKISAHNELRRYQEESGVVQRFNTALPDIGPVIHRGDPQKGRFGGKSINNGRALKATVSKAPFPGFFNITLWVEALDPQVPLDHEVILYLHDSFSPSVVHIAPDEFRDGKAIDSDILAYGAFTVGAVTDQGRTLLELDLAEQPEFPLEFRER